MKIVIMGAGAMGSLFAGFLVSSNEEVWLIDIRQEQIDAIHSIGLTLEENETSQILHVNATSDVTSVGKADLVIFFVKSYHTEKAASDSFILQKGDTIFLTLQNGLGN
jgi:2-dehydropantoate 2-reductase